MENKITEAKSKITRRNYSRISQYLELPNLVEIQTNSYKWFKEVGIKEVFEDIYPITNFNETLSLEFVDLHLMKQNIQSKRAKTVMLTMLHQLEHLYV